MSQAGILVEDRAEPRTTENKIEGHNDGLLVRAHRPNFFLMCWVRCITSHDSGQIAPSRPSYFIHELPVSFHTRIGQAFFASAGAGCII